TWPSSASSSSVVMPRCCRSTVAPTRSRCHRSPAACSRVTSVPTHAARSRAAQRRKTAEADRGLATPARSPYRIRMWLLVAISLLVGPASRLQAAPLLKVGDPFPPWTLTDNAGKPVSSADLAGKTYLLWFYPKAMTPGCTAEGRGLRDD